MIDKLLIGVQCLGYLMLFLGIGWCAVGGMRS